MGVLLGWDNEKRTEKEQAARPATQLVLPLHDVTPKFEKQKPQISPSHRIRTRRVIEAFISAIFGKGIVLLVNASSIPIAIRYLGAEMFGVWVTISTTLTLLLILDLGIANAVTNLISSAYAKEDRKLAASYSTVSFWSMVAIACFLGLIGAVLYPVVPWGGLFHLHSMQKDAMAAHAVAAAYVVFLFGLPAGLAAKLLGGYQEMRLANLFAAAGSVVGLAGLASAVAQHATISWLVATASGAAVL